MTGFSRLYRLDRYLKIKPLILNFSLVTLLSVLERAGGLLQTIFVARLLGIHDYGVFGLLVGTIGITASMAAVQMGTTATVFVSRYREREKAKATFVIQFVNNFTYAVICLILVIALPASPLLTSWLVGDDTYLLSVISGCILVGLSILSGVQDGIVQGFEDFRSVVWARLFTTLVSFAAIYPLGLMLGLSGVMMALLVAPTLKFVYLSWVVRDHKERWKLPAKGYGVSVKDLLWGFSVPSVLSTVFYGIATWYGNYVLSRQPQGFGDVAISTLGAQWRGPVILLVTAVSAVCIPAISRMQNYEDKSQIRRIRRGSLLFNGIISSGAILLTIAAAPLLLAAYGSEFIGGTVVFSLLIASALPQALATSYLQELVGQGRMWLQNMLYLFLTIPMVIGFHLGIPRYGDIAYALVTLLSWFIFLVALIIANRLFNR